MAEFETSPVKNRELSENNGEAKESVRIKKMLIIIPPCGAKPTSYPPYGALYLGTYLKKNGYELELLNIDMNQWDLQKVLNYIEQYAPDIIGFSAIVSNSYRYIKDFSFAIRNRFPEIVMILGGQLSNAANVVLLNTAIDIIVIGEGEQTVIRLMEAIKKESDLNGVKGIAFKENGNVVYTPAVDLIKNLDDLPFPDYTLIEMDRYLLDPLKRFKFCIDHIDDKRFKEPERLKQKAFTIMTGRGCHAQCTFCCRNIKGLRKHSADYVLDLIEYLKKTYNVGYFTFGDESFISTKKWTLDFLDKLQKRKLDIMFYVLGARVDIVDEELLRALKDSGCIMIEYGYETGSQRMLDIIEKKVTVAENYRTHWRTIKTGLYTIPANIINMPGETSGTIDETIKFLKSLELEEDCDLMVKYAQAQPGTPLYEFALLTGLIEDEDKYLTNIHDVHPSNLEGAYKKGVLLNFSGQPLSEVSSWIHRIIGEVRKDAKKRRLKRQKKILQYLLFVIKHDLLSTFISKEKKQISLLGKTFKIVYPKLRISAKKPSQAEKKLTVEQQTGNGKYLNQIGLENDELIKKIKHNKYDSREIITGTGNRFIECYRDQVDGHTVLRYQSLRKVCRAIAESQERDGGS